MSARTIRRRLSGLSGFDACLSARGLVHASPVPSGPLSRSPKDRARGGRLPLIRTPGTLPRVLDPAEVNALLTAHQPGYGDGACNAARRAAPLRGAWPAARGRAAG